MTPAETVITDRRLAAYRGGLRRAAAIARARCTCTPRRRRPRDCPACQIAQAIDYERTSCAP